MTKEERELRREQREHMKRMEAAAKEAGRGPIDVPFLLLVLLLTGVGLIMLLSASFPSAYYESGDPLYYFKRQGGVCPPRPFPPPPLPLPLLPVRSTT